MSSAGGSTTQQGANPDVLLSSLVKHLDLEDGSSDFIKRYQETQHSAQKSVDETLLRAESHALDKFQSYGFGALLKDDSIAKALEASRQIYEESVSQGSKMHCKYFRKLLGLTQWFYSFEEALYESTYLDTAGVELLEKLLGRSLPKESLEFELVRTAYQIYRDLRNIPAYPYRPLNSETEEIRLLVVPPNLNDSATIQCKLISSNKKGRSTYVALSYCWGQKDSENPSSIELEGQIFEVTPNLHSALRRLRSQTTKLYLWVDALCINQADIEERNDQVSRMKAIYQNAMFVLCFLGEEENQSNIAMEFLLNFEEADDRGRWLQENRPKNSTIQMNSLNALVSRDYWRRVWIMQEIALSPKTYICCGKYIISWETLVTFLVLPSQGGWSETALLKTAAKAGLIPLASLWYKKKYGMRISLLDALVMSRQRNATVLHDHIYGVTAIVDTWTPKVDYGIPVPIFYLETTTKILMDPDEKNLDILSMCKGFDPDQHIVDDTVRKIIEVLTKRPVENNGVSRSDARGADFESTFQDVIFSEAYLRENPLLKESLQSFLDEAGLATLPSWIPRLDDNSIRDFEYILLNPMRNANDQASRGTLSDIRLAPGGRELIVKGLILDQVSCVSTNHISKLKEFLADIKDLMNISKRPGLGGIYGLVQRDWKSWDAKVNNSHRWKVWDKRKNSRTSNPYGGLDSQKEAFTETYFMGSQFSELSIRTFARTAIAYLAGWGVSRHVPGPGNADEDIMELLLRAFLHKFFIGERKFMGRGPKPMKKGDLVCIFYGGKVPFILRPWGDQYYLMGECYVQGVMNGEAITMRDSWKLEEREFTLI